MTYPRAGHTATLLPNAETLLAAGQDGAPLTTAELFSRSSASFALLPSTISGWQRAG